MIVHLSEIRRFSCSLVGATLVGLVLVTGCGPTAPQRPAAGPPEIVVTSPLKRKLVEWDEYIGRVEAIESVEVRARVSGYLQSTHFDEGQIVKEGDLLCVIDPKPFEAEVGHAQAVVAENQAKVTQARAEQNASEATRRSAQSRLDLANKQSVRIETLMRKGGAPVADLDVRQTEVLQAKAAYDEASAKIEAAKAAVITAESAVKTAESNLDIAKLNLSYTRVYAPITGLVSRRVVTEGNLISGGTSQSTLLTTVNSVDPIHCYFDVDEQDLLKYMRLRQARLRASSRDTRNPVYLAVADEGAKFTRRGYVDFVDNRLDLNTGTLRVRAIFANPDRVLLPGIFGRVRLPGSGNSEAVLLQDRCISTDQADKFVYVVGPDDTVKRQVIELGPIAHGLRIIRKGLDGTERVVFRGLQRVRPGIKVHATMEPTEITVDDGLPDHYESVPPEQWLKKPHHSAVQPASSFDTEVLPPANGAVRK